MLLPCCAASRLSKRLMAYTGYIGEVMDKPPFSLALVMVKESFAVPAILIYLALTLTKTSVRTTLSIRLWADMQK
jgi:hypothetical protein